MERERVVAVDGLGGRGSGYVIAPQLVLRLGFPSSGAPLPATPRRPIAEVLYSETG